MSSPAAPGERRRQKPSATSPGGAKARNAAPGKPRKRRSMPGKPRINTPAKVKPAPPAQPASTEPKLKRFRKYDGWEANAHKDKKLKPSGDPVNETAKAAPSTKHKKAKLAKGEYEARLAVAQSIHKQSGAEQCEWVWSQFAAATHATPLDRDGLTESCFIPLEGDDLQHALKGALPKWKQLLSGAPGGVKGRSRIEPPKPGEASPRLVLISGNATEACATIKSLPDFNAAPLKIAKLFAKHIKASEQEALLSSTAVASAAGTPHRLLQLSDAGALHWTQCRLLAIDVRLNVKKQNIFSTRETADDMWRLLEKHAWPRAKAGTLKIALYSS